MPPIRIQGLTKTDKDGPRLRAKAVPDALDGASVAEHVLA
jgi:hypothetical protein